MPDLPRPRLQVRPRSNPDRFRDARVAERGCELRHERSIAFALLPPQPVVEMPDHQGESLRRRQRRQNSEERHGVGPSGDGNQDAVSRVHQLIAFDGRGYLANERLGFHNSGALLRGSFHGSFARGRLHAFALTLLAGLLLAVTAPADPPRPQAPQLPRSPFGQPTPPEIAALLRKTTDAYGADAAALQVEFLHQVVHAGSVLPAGVRVRGLERHGTYHYLLFFVETGIVFNSGQSDPAGRRRQLWADVVAPVLGRWPSYDVPADGIAVELHYTHRSYVSSEQLADTVLTDPGVPEATAVFLLRNDILAFRAQRFDADDLFDRSGPAGTETTSEVPPGAPGGARGENEPVERAKP